MNGTSKLVSVPCLDNVFVNIEYWNCSHALAIEFQQQVIDAWESHGASAEEELKEALRLLDQLKRKARGALSNEVPMKALPLRGAMSNEGPRKALPLPTNTSATSDVSQPNIPLCQSRTV